MSNIKLGDMVYIIGPKNIKCREEIYLGREYVFSKLMDHFIGKIYKVKRIDTNFQNCFRIGDDKEYHFYFHPEWLIKL